MNLRLEVTLEPLSRSFSRAYGTDILYEPSPPVELASYFRSSLRDGEK